MAGQQTEQKFEINEKKQMLVLVRYKPADAMAADDMLGGITSKVQGVVDTVENAANAIPGLSLFFKEEKEPDKKVDKEYTFFKDYKDWDSYMKKMKDELPNKLNPDNKTLVFDFDSDDASGRESEGKKLSNQIKSAVSTWKGYTSVFHFVGLEQGGNVANEAIKELTKESDFKEKWKVASVIYVATPLYAHLHSFDQKAAGNPSIHSFGNIFDLTHQAIQYLEPNKDLLKMISESNTNTLSVFTGKIKAQLVSTLGRLLTIKGFGTGHDNEGNIDKLTQCKNDVEGLVKELVNAVKSIADAVPGIIKPPDLPKFDQMLNGFDSIPGKSVKRLERFIDELKNVREGTSLDTSRINLSKIFNFLCPLVDKLTESLQLFSFDSETSHQMTAKVLEKAGVTKILSPAVTSSKTLPVDPYFEKVAEMAKEADKKAATAKKAGEQEADKPAEKILYDQSILMISKARANIMEVASKSDVEISHASNADKAKIAEAIAALTLPMMPNKGKFYGAILQFIPTGGLNSFLSKITSDAAFSPLKGVMNNLKGNFDFDPGTPEEPGLKTSLQNFDKELKRITGFFDKNNYPVHKDANSLYFIYNSHNIMLKKPWGEILNTIDRATGYLDVMKAQGYNNIVNLDENKYQGGGAQKENVQPTKAVEEEAV
ncbi:MAG TPA: hypothetical protein PK191_07420 [Niabella sp.]|nr:hypothetical protein [Niabella sp.]HOZ96794.1 hypothetical protein [Niabella sp.]HQW14729.1 hypothetical protein [Niabella sp.]HQX20019.1 hypothetical protein [Niabella sp.]HQX40639.1 hypothetical protein [Niabella sp.]